jgi:hypothetical protein
MVLRICRGIAQAGRRSGSRQKRMNWFMFSGVISMDSFDLVRELCFQIVDDLDAEGSANIDM